MSGNDHEAVFLLKTKDSFSGRISLTVTMARKMLPMQLFEAILLVGAWQEAIDLHSLRTGELDNTEPF